MRQLGADRSLWQHDRKETHKRQMIYQPVPLANDPSILVQEAHSLTSTTTLDEQAARMLLPGPVGRGIVQRRLQDRLNT